MRSWLNARYRSRNACSLVHGHTAVRIIDRFRRFSEQALRGTGTGDAPWTLIGARDRRYRSMTVARTLLDALEERLAAIASEKPAERVPVAAASAVTGLAGVP